MPPGLQGQLNREQLPVFNIMVSLWGTETVRIESTCMQLVHGVVLQQHISYPNIRSLNDELFTGVRLNQHWSLVKALCASGDQQKITLIEVRLVREDAT